MSGVNWSNRRIKQELELKGSPAAEIFVAKAKEPANPYLLLQGDQGAVRHFNEWDDAYKQLILISNAISIIVPDPTRFTVNRWVPHAQRLIRPFDSSLSDGYLFLPENADDHAQAFTEMASRLPERDAVRCSMPEHALEVALGKVVLLARPIAQVT